MKYADLKNKDEKELQQMLKDLQVKLGKFKFELANKSLKDYSQVGKTKRDIAQVMTAINAVNTK